MSEQGLELGTERDPLLGVLLGGKYRVDGVLGHGATGRVYRAIQEPISRSVAVKVLRPDLPPDEQRSFEIRFLREASQAGALQHPNVVTVHDFGRADDGTCYIVMEMLRGRSLKDLLKEGPVPAARALDIFEQMVRGLRAAHASGMVHRDVKPGNVFLLRGEERRDFVKILDFGLVKDLDAVTAVSDPMGLESLSIDDLSTEATVTRHGVFLGTPHYVPPEQARGARVDGRADLYSAGVVLYRMVTGKLPFYDKNAAVMALAHIQSPYPPMAERAPEVRVPEPVEALVRRCMEKDPDARPADADALLAEIAATRKALHLNEVTTQPVIAEATATLSQPILPPPLLLPAPAPERSRSRIGLVAAALMGLFALVAAYVAWPEPTPTVAVAETRPVKVFFTSTPDAAEVFLDGVSLGRTPFVWGRDVPVTGDPPTLAFVVKHEGYAETPLSLTLAGDEVVGQATLSPLQAAPEVVASQPAAERSPRPARKAEPTASEPSPAQKAAPEKAAPEAAPEKPAPAKASPTSGTVSADGIAFTPEEAAAAVRFLNAATDAELHGAGIAGQQVKIILEGRPWSDVLGFAATYKIGEKTVAAVKAASSK